MQRLVGGEAGLVIGGSALLKKPRPGGANGLGPQKGGTRPGGGGVTAFEKQKANQTERLEWLSGMLTALTAEWIGRGWRGKENRGNERKVLGLPHDEKAKQAVSGRPQG